MADPYRVTDDWQEGYDAGYESGYEAGIRHRKPRATHMADLQRSRESQIEKDIRYGFLKPKTSKPKRKLSAWNKFVKANSKKPRFKYKSGAKKGKLNLKAMAVAFRRTPAGKKKKK